MCEQSLTNFYTKRLEIVKRTLSEAAEIAMRLFGKVSGTGKNDGTFVTQADGEVERYILQKLQENFPEDTVVGEETGVHEHASPYMWSVDPIDGTAAYLCRMPFWGISVGMIKDGLPVLGAVYLPVLDELYYAADKCGAYMESKIWGLQKLDIREADLSQKEHLILIPSTFHHNYVLSSKRKARSLGSCVANALMVARGDASCAFANSYHWDLAGCLSILLEAGGCVRRLDGKDFRILDLQKNGQPKPTVLLSNPQDLEINLNVAKPIQKDRFI
ncbi:inositol monophosphatase [bacterium]|nr:inositol monophosphatase [bacterium]